jgi:NADH-quinone oxidoreductase subunit M
MAVLGVALGTTYILWLYYRVALGEPNHGLQGLRLDLNYREAAILTSLALLVLVIGLYPEIVLGFVRPSVAKLLTASPEAPGGT